MKKLSCVMAVTILFGVWLTYCEIESGANSTRYYDSSILKSPQLPAWNPTNAIPLTPDKAVIAAIEAAKLRKPSSAEWYVDSIHLRRHTEETAWFYVIDLVDKKAKNPSTEVVRVLLNGKVWMPMTKPK